MREWFSEFVMVLAYSQKTQWAIFLGIFGFFAIQLLGLHLLDNFEVKGLMAPMMEALRDKFLRRYDKLAWACLITFLLLAAKMYCRDRKRLFS